MMDSITDHNLADALRLRDLMPIEREEAIREIVERIASGLARWAASSVYGESA